MSASVLFTLTLLATGVCPPGPASLDCDVLEESLGEAFPEGSCPAVFKVWGEESSEDAWNLVFLSEGFTVDELPVYRCAVGLFVQDLLEAAPYSDLSCNMNVYRLDIAAPVSGIGTAPCADPESCPHYEPYWPDEDRCTPCAELTAKLPESDQPFLGARVPYETQGLEEAPADCLVTSLKAQHCQVNSEVCNFIWLDLLGKERASRLAECTPLAPNAVVIVANSGRQTAAGTYAKDSSLPMALVTLFDIDDEALRSINLLHELGHTFTLLDEYEGSGSETYVEQRNVWIESRAQEPLPGWNHLCGEAAGLAGDHLCQRKCNDDPDCPDCPDCTDCSDCAGCLDYTDCPACIDSGVSPLVGLYEGAFYNNCNRYRPSRDCLMREGSEFCDVCQGLKAEMFLGSNQAFCYDRCRGEKGCLYRMDILPRVGELRVLPPGFGPSAPVLPRPRPDPPPFLFARVPEELFQPLGRFRATVVIDGTEAEIDIESMELRFKTRAPRPGPPVRPSTHKLVARRVEAGFYPRLEWELDGHVLQPSPQPMRLKKSPTVLEIDPGASLTVRTLRGSRELEAEKVDIRLWDVPDPGLALAEGSQQDEMQPPDSKQ